MRRALLLSLLAIIGEAYRRLFQEPHRAVHALPCTSMERPVDLPMTPLGRHMLPRDRTFTSPSSTSSSKTSHHRPTRFIHPQVIKMFNRAQYLMQIGDNQVALKLLKRCLELNPLDSHSWLALARLESRLGNIHRAREIFQLATTTCPKNIHLLHAWGHLEQKHGNEAIARECWSEAMHVSTDTSLVLMMAGINHMDLSWNR